MGTLDVENEYGGNWYGFQATLVLKSKGILR